MKITKKIESEIKSAMNDYWESYLKGNLDQWASYLVSDYRNIGTTEIEIWNSKKEIIDYSNSVLDQMVGLTELRNKKTEIIPYDPYVMVHEYLDIYIKADDEWIFYSKLRLSSLIQKFNKTWNILHQHGSYPDSKVTDGEFFAFNTLKSENLKLQKAVKNRTEELEKTNRELEIETSLERVRAIALSMKEPADMLEVCKTISLQLQSLGVKEIRNVQTAIFNEQRGTYMNYEYYAKHRKAIITETDYTNNKTHKAFAAKMLKGKGEFFITHIKGKKVKEWIEYQKSTNVFVDKYLNKASSLNYYWYSLGPVALGISTYHPLVKEETNQFNRFLKVFELAYRRYLDIEKAIAQAKEAQIEVALERVRSRSMAMHSSDELVEASDVMFDQMKKLGIETLRIGICTIDAETGSAEIWSRSEIKGKLKNTILGVVPQGVHPIFDSMVKAWREKKPYFFSERVGEEVKDYYKRLSKYLSYPMPKKFNKKESITTFFFKAGSLNVISLEPLKEEECDIMIRFAKVFEQTYTRFLDLQKAEAQARESQIQLSLERIRARSMAMQSSDELTEVLSVLFEQFNLLGINPVWAHLSLINLDNNTFTYRMTGIRGERVLAEQIVDLNARPEWKGAVEAFKSGKPNTGSFLHFPKKALPQIWELFDESFSALPEDAKVYQNDFPDGLFNIQGYCKYGYIGFNHNRPASEEEKEIVIRFATEFGRVYQRFLDIEKAEAQAKEAQIEASLERVRTRSMAMHKSDELLQAGELLYKELSKLGITKLVCGYVLIDMENKVGWNYGVNPGTGTIKPLPTGNPLAGTKVLESITMSWEKQDPLLVIELDPQETIKHQTYIAENVINFPITKEQLLSISPEKLKIHTFNFSQGYLLIVGDLLLNVEQQEMVVRFAKVFEMTYRRFLDIQKAEAQAREAQIETALERVRSRTMGMQKSVELKEVIQIVYDQFIHLNIHIEHTGFIMDYKSRDDMHIWLADQHEVPFEVTIPYFDCAHWNSFIDAKTKGKDFFANHLTFEEKNKFYQDLFNFIPDVPQKTVDYYFSCPGLAISTVLLENVGLYIENFSGIPYSSEENNILKRFGKVFQQTYTRFLDLQKAEAQARESQIEAALEKVRSRSLGMQNSDEIKDVVVTVMEKMNELNIEMNGGVSLATFVQDTNDLIHWYVNPDHVDGPVTMHLPYFENVLFSDFIKARKSGKELLPVVYSFEEKNKYFQYAFEHSDFRIISEELKKWILEQPYFGYSVAIQKHSAIFFNDYTGKLFSVEENDILIRFAKVFDQAYTRFLDLQKAEIQTREAEIQLAMERVRARTMAMQKSDELPEAANLLFQQVKSLGLPAWSAGYCLWEDKRKAITLWMSSEDVIQQSFKIPTTDEWTFIKFREAYEKGELFVAFDIGGKEIIEHYNYLKKLPGISDSLKKIEDEGHPLPNYQIFHCAYFSHGFLLFITYEPVTDSWDIFKRFASVFEQTYIRFLDLQKAEAQAREAQIEAALERIRARAMGMHKSEEVGYVSDMLFSELNQLDFEINGSSIVIIDEEKDTMELWRARSDVAVTPFERSSFNKAMKILKKNMPKWHPIFLSALNKRKNYLLDELSGKRRLKFIESIAEQYNYSSKEKNKLIENTPKTISTHYIFFKLGYLALLSERNLSEENILIVRRFVEVFDFSYTRFLDIQKAEAQAREAQIEAALERVRARTMAMQKSNELAQTAAHLFSQLNGLGIKPYRCNIAIVEKEFKKCRIWSTTNSGNVIPTGSALPLDEYPVLKEMYNGWKTQKPNHIFKLVGKERLEWTKYIRQHLPFEEYKKNNMNEAELQNEAAFFTNLYFRQGFFTIHSNDELTEEQIKIIQRFAYVFEQTYTRFLDLENAEKQNKIIQAENERKTEELEEARQLQLSMLPKELPQLPNLDIAVYMQTATEVGGDYYDFRVDEKGVLTAVIGDATGHGMKAGTIVTITKSMFNSLASEKNILKIFSQISQVIRDMKFRQLSMCLLMLKIYENKVQISSAAMPPAYLYRKSKKKVDEIVLNGMPLGAIHNFPYKVKETTISSGDTILLMSDGYPELMNDMGSMFGYEKAIKLFEKLAEKPSKDIVEGLKNSASEWVRNKMPDDDVTFVVIKVK